MHLRLIFQRTKGIVFFDNRAKLIAKFFPGKYSYGDLFETLEKIIYVTKDLPKDFTAAQAKRIFDEVRSFSFEMNKLDIQLIGNNQDIPTILLIAYTKAADGLINSLLKALNSFK